jgi:hypothetical protein
VWLTHHFRSPQLTLIDIAPHEWVLYWRVPSYAPRRTTRRIPGVVQLPLFDLSVEEKAVGAEETGITREGRHLHLIKRFTEGQETEEE